MHVFGVFSDVDRPDVFVWMRGFADMERRRDSLNAFYYGPAWRAHSAAANAMMIDSDDVLLLESACAGRSVADHVGPRPPQGATSVGSAEIDVAIHPVRPEDTESYLHRQVENLVPVQQRFGAHPLPPLKSLHAANTFPQLPVHEDRHVVVTLTRYDSSGAAAHMRDELAYRGATDALDTLAIGPVQRLRLIPTPRSALR
jgi:hypothetical protein